MVNIKKNFLKSIEPVLWSVAYVLFALSPFLILGLIFFVNHLDAPNRIEISEYNANLFAERLSGESFVAGCRSSGLCTIEHNGEVGSFYCPNRFKPEKPVCVQPDNQY